MSDSPPVNMVDAFYTTPPIARGAFVTDYLHSARDDIHMVWDVLDIYSADPSVFTDAVAKALEREKDNLCAHRAMVWIATREGRFDEAVKHLRYLIDVLPSAAVERRELLRVGFVAKEVLTPENQALGLEAIDTGLSRASYDFQISRALGASTMTAHADQLRALFQEAGEGIKQQIRSAPGRTPLVDLLDTLDRSTRIALVGNGPSLRGAGRGLEIDRYDLVIRCNFPVIENFAADVGSRTDAVLFTEALFRLFNMYLDRDRSYRSARLITIENPAAAAGFDPDTMGMATGTTIARIPAVAMDLMKEASYRHLTTGALAYLLLAGLFGKQITIFGFDFYSQKDLHYFSQSAGLWLPHEVQYEKFLFRGVVKPVFGAYFR